MEHLVTICSHTDDKTMLVLRLNSQSIAKLLNLIDTKRYYIVVA